MPAQRLLNYGGQELYMDVVRAAGTHCSCLLAPLECVLAKDWDVGKV